MSRALRTSTRRLALLGLVLAPLGCGTKADRAAPGPSATAVEQTAGVAPSAMTRFRRTFFVSPDGRDSNPGTRRRPFRTLGHALARLRAGERLFVRGGTYVEHIDLHAAPGRPRARILVRNFARERPVVKGQLWLLRASYWTVHGINVTRFGDERINLVRFSGGTGWIFENSEIWDSRAQAGLLIDDGANDNRPIGRFTVRENCIHDTVPNAGPNQDHNVYVNDFNRSPQANGLIERNIMFDAPNGRGIKFGPGNGVGGPHDVIARYNTIYNSAQNIGVSSDSYDITLERNLLIRANQANIWSFELRGAHNVARDNALGGAARQFQSGGTSPAPVVNGAGNVRLTTGFDALSCSGFHPTNPAAQAYGRYAPER